MSEAKKRARLKYDGANTVQIKLKLNKKTDADILERFGEVGNKQGYIKRLVRKDLEEEREKLLQNPVEQGRII